MSMRYTTNLGKSLRKTYDSILAVLSQSYVIFVAELQVLSA